MKLQKDAKYMSKKASLEFFKDWLLHIFLLSPWMGFRINFPDTLSIHPCIYLGCGYVGMTEHFLNRA